MDFFLKQGLKKKSMKLCEEAATLADTKIRQDLIACLLDKSKKDDSSGKVLLITRYNPNFQDLRKITHENWEMLG